MGTNFYLMSDFCIKCQRGERLHLGKSSCGWKFLIRANEDCYQNIREMEEFLKGAISEGSFIIDDCDNNIDLKKFLKTITDSQYEKSNWNTMGQSVSGRDEKFKIVNGYEFYDGEFS